MMLGRLHHWRFDSSEVRSFEITSFRKKANAATPVRAIHGTIDFRREDAPLERNMSTTQPTIDYQTQNSPLSRYFSTTER